MRSEAVVSTTSWPRSRITSSTDWIDFQADDRFYRTKGELYAYALLMRELSKDFEPVIKERGLQTVWANMLENLFQAAELHPWVVVNGAPDSQLLPAEIVETVRLRGQTADEDTSLPCHGPSCATAGVIGLTIKPLVLCANPRATTGQPPHTPAPRTAMVRGAAGKAGGLFTP